MVGGVYVTKQRYFCRVNAHNDMQVLTGEGHDGCHWCNQPGAYEWWYVDARDVTGEWGAVVILFRGMPMSPDYLAAAGSNRVHPTDSCGYSVSLYHRDERIAMAFRGVDASRCSFADSPTVVVGPAALHFEASELIVNVDTADDRQPQRVVLRMELRAPWDGTSSDAPFQDQHGWVLASPYLEGTLYVEVHQNRQCMVRRSLSVTGYHDHNMGRRSMQSDFGDWHWGRFHVDGGTFVFLSTTDFCWAGRVDGDGIWPWENVRCFIKRRRLGLLGLVSPKGLTLEGTGSPGQRVTIEHKRVLEDGPFYQRYSSRCFFDDGRVVDGYGEYMNIRRFTRAWIRPFLRLPWLT